MSKLPHEMLLEKMGESEMAFVSAEFWCSYLPQTHKFAKDELWDQLAAFQHGWLAAKQHYKINE